MGVGWGLFLGVGGCLRRIITITALKCQHINRGNTHTRGKYPGELAGELAGVGPGGLIITRKAGKCQHVNQGEYTHRGKLAGGGVVFGWVWSCLVWVLSCCVGWCRGWLGCVTFGRASRHDRSERGGSGRGASGRGRGFVGVSRFPKFSKNRKNRLFWRFVWLLVC